MSDKRGVTILGGHQTDFARNWKKEGKHLSELMRESVQGALEAASVEPGEVQSAHVGNFAGELYCKQGHLGAFFLEADPAFDGLPTSRHEAACASGSIAILAASAEIEAGRVDLSCVVGIEQMKTVSPREGGDFLGAASWYERESAGVEFPFPKLFGQLGDEYDRRYGLRSEHLDAISELNYANAKRNPNAQTRGWKPRDDNPDVAGRLRLSDCSQITDGAAVLLLASDDFAARYASRRGIDRATLPRIAGWGHRTAPLLFADKLAASRDEPYILPNVRSAILDAFRRAKISDVNEIDGIETHDCFTTSEYMAIDHFGITPPGESWKAIEEGKLEIGGAHPINPSGGLIGAGHPVGATGVRQCLDATKQVTGIAGEYQVEGARRFATLNIGGSATTTVCLVVAV